MSGLADSINGFRLKPGGFRLKLGGFRLKLDGFRLKLDALQYDKLDKNKNKIYLLVPSDVINRVFPSNRFSIT
jgi:hypothetical protein